MPVARWYPSSNVAEKIVYVRATWSAAIAMMADAASHSNRFRFEAARPLGDDD
jgi:hypothetical protein